jgi:signal transduction histidine kinase
MRARAPGHPVPAAAAARSWPRPPGRFRDNGAVAEEAPVEPDPQRLLALIEVGRTLLGELRLEAVLDGVLETARQLTGARYAALGILDAEKRELARFLTRGIDADVHRAIGDLPRGRGVLGALITDPRPLRLHDVSSDPRSYGFPAEHPPMSTFLGVPVVIRGEAWGNLYLTGKEGGADFDEADEASVVVLADWAAIAIENARLYERLDARRDELERAVRGFEATAAIAQAVGADTDLDRVLELVVKRGRALVNARAVLVLLTEGGALGLAATAGHTVASEARVTAGGTLLGDVLASGRPRRIDDLDTQRGFDGRPLGVLDAAAALLVPLVYKGRPLGVLCAFDRLDERIAFDDDEQLLRAFAASAATAVATARSVESDRVRAALRSAEAERRRWARELHDETLQALGGLKVMLSGAARSDDPERARQAMAASVEAISQEIENLRAIIADLRPASLDALGLAPALETLVARVATAQGLDATTTIELGQDAGRLDPELETAIYRVAQEALTNVAKHAGAHRVEVGLRRNGSHVLLTVQDDGSGFDPKAATAGFGLAGIRERIAILGGTLDLRAEAGTRLDAAFPVDAVSR